ncbi:MAG: diacylglycerol kinase family lipid kinase [Anaerolineales bacterium]|nr:diacylglycerol kinase family lipid kinase [Anaerolineales bacterium]
MRVKIIMNPYSNSGRASKEQTAVIQAVKSQGDCHFAMTEHSGHARQLASEAALEGYDVVVAAGGDGTVHQVINGLFDAAQPGAKFGVIPIGSGNDFAFARNILVDVDTAVQRIFHGKPTKFDLARVEDDRGRTELIGNNFGVGFDANVVIRTAEITKATGFLMYLLGVFKTLRYDFEMVPLVIQFDEEHVAQDVLLIAFGIGPRHGGGFFLTPDALLQDNLVDSCLVHVLNRPTALYMLSRAIKGTHITSHHVTMRQNERIQIYSEMALPVHIDGEVFAYPEDDVHHLTITSLPGVLEMMV